MTLEHFKLPRDDWYDTVSTDPETGEIIGRLYKEALIENFNALENKFNELSSLTAYETQIPDFATYDYDDVTLDSESNKVVNLKSFLTIMDLIGVPLDISFSGKICKKISYYDKNMRLHTITNQTIEGLGVDDKVYVVLDTANDTVYATADTTDLSGKFLIGIYENGTIYNVNSKNLLDINILTHLCDMSIETRNFGTIPRDMIPTNLTINNRAVGAWGRESRGAWASDVVLSDVGRISK